MIKLAVLLLLWAKLFEKCWLNTCCKKSLSKPFFTTRQHRVTSPISIDFFPVFFPVLCLYLRAISMYGQPMYGHMSWLAMIHCLNWSLFFCKVVAPVSSIFNVFNSLETSSSDNALSLSLLSHSTIDNNDVDVLHWQQKPRCTSCLFFAIPWKWPSMTWHKWPNQTYYHMIRNYDYLWI